MYTPTVHLVYTMYTPLYTWYTPTVHLVYTMYTPTVYLVYTMYTPIVHLLYTMYTPTVRLVYTMYTPTVHLVYNIYTPNVHLVYTMYTPTVHLVYTMYTPTVYLVYTMYTPIVHLLYTMYTPNVHLVYTMYTPTVHLVYNMYTPTVHLVYTMYTPTVHLVYTMYTPTVYLVYTMYTPIVHLLYTMYTPTVHLVYNMYTPTVHLVYTMYTPTVHLVYTMYTPTVHLVYNMYTPTVHLVHPYARCKYPNVHVHIDMHMHQIFPSMHPKGMVLTPDSILRFWVLGTLCMRLHVLTQYRMCEETTDEVDQLEVPQHGSRVASTIPSRTTLRALLLPIFQLQVMIDGESTTPLRAKVHLLEREDERLEHLDGTSVSIWTIQVLECVLYRRWLPSHQEGDDGMNETLQQIVRGCLGRTVRRHQLQRLQDQLSVWCRLTSLSIDMTCCRGKHIRKEVTPSM
jgi:hypothetical protein